MKATIAGLAAAMLLAVAAPAHADNVVRSSQGGREGAGTSAGGKLKWVFGGGFAVIGNSTGRTIRYRCTGNRSGAFDRVVMKGTLGKGQQDEWYIKGRPATVQQMKCSVRFVL